MPVSMNPIPWAARVPAGYAIGPTGAVAEDGASTANRLYLAPVIISAPQTFSTAGILAAATGVANKLCRFGVYRPNSNDPASGVLIADLGTDVLPVDTPADNSSGVPVSLGPGLYYLAAIFEQNGTMRRVSCATLATPVQQPSLGYSRPAYYVDLGSFPGAMPASFSGALSVDYAACIQLRP